ncbi:hypothetical protein GSI_05700 [Ganoderma sinense ZZ0214-1]|uniref:Uncharacterized protein n=1 Tax=Ganoderma sinense ZZ0214-1 TaxID=1077348 RepID=A0A2G8SB65_9APHY|nr:hypothetical protein GSI_05700 [Ganoderma sinense ZZ0214-1]
MSKNTCSGGSRAKGKEKAAAMTNLKKTPAIKKAEKIAGQWCKAPTPTIHRHKRPNTMVIKEDSESESDSDSEPEKVSHSSRPPAKKTKTAASSTEVEDDLKRDGLAIVDSSDEGDADGVWKESDGKEEVEVMFEDELQRAQECWRSPIYGFFKPEVEVSYKKGWQSHVFAYAAKGCKMKVQRYLDTGDRASSGNLFKHACLCWTDKVVNHAVELGSADIIREEVMKATLRSGSIMEFFEKKNPKKLTFSHWPLTKAKSFKAERRSTCR